jgi:hypothetical protein
VHNKSTPRPYPILLYYIFTYYTYRHLTIVGCTRCSHSMLIHLCGCSTTLPLYFPHLRVYCWVLTHLWVCSLTHTHSLSLSLFLYLWVRTFLFSLTRLQVIFLPSTLCELLNVPSHPSLGCIPLISNKPFVWVTLAARHTHFNNILESRGCSSHPYTRSLWVTL